MRKYLAAFYYMRDSNNAPRITVCLLVRANDTGIFIASRGLSICARIDCVNKKIGRGIALERATCAVREHGHWGPIIKPGIVPSWPSRDFKYKAMLCPIPTEYESKLMAKIAEHTTRGFDNTNGLREVFIDTGEDPG